LKTVPQKEIPSISKSFTYSDIASKVKFYATGR